MCPDIRDLTSLREYLLCAGPVLGHRHVFSPSMLIARFTERISSFILQIGKLPPRWVKEPSQSPMVTKWITVGKDSSLTGAPGPHSRALVSC